MCNNNSTLFYTLVVYSIFCIFLHCVPKKYYTKLKVITLSVVNGFSNFFSLLEREVNFQQNPYNTSQHAFSICCWTTLRNLEVWICGKFRKKNKKSCHIWQKLKYILSGLNIVSIIARSVHLLPAHMREDVNTTRHCQWWPGQCHAKHAENAVSVHNTCLDKIICYLQRTATGNWNSK